MLSNYFVIVDLSDHLLVGDCNEYALLQCHHTVKVTSDSFVGCTHCTFSLASEEVVFSPAPEEETFSLASEEMDRKYIFTSFRGNGQEVHFH